MINKLRNNTLLAIFCLLATTIYGQENFENQFLKIQEGIATSTKYSTVVNYMNEHNYKLDSKEIEEEDNSEYFIFIGGHKQLVIVAYSKYKKLMYVKSNLLALNVVFCEMELKDKNFNLLSTVNDEYLGEKWTETTWGKTGYLHRFSFEKSDKKLSWLYLYTDGKSETNESLLTGFGSPELSQLDNGQLKAIENKIFGRSEKHDGMPTATKVELVNYLNTLAKSTIGNKMYKASNMHVLKSWFTVNGTAVKYYIQHPVADKNDIQTLEYHFDLEDLSECYVVSDNNALLQRIGLVFKEKLCEQNYWRPASFKDVNVSDVKEIYFFIDPTIADKYKVYNAFYMLRFITTGK